MKVEESEAENGYLTVEELGTWPWHSYSKQKESKLISQTGFLEFVLLTNQVAFKTTPNTSLIKKHLKPYYGWGDRETLSLK